MTWCNFCRNYQKSWYDTCKGTCNSDCKNRCAKCDNHFNSIVVSPTQSQVATTAEQRAQLAREAANWTNENGMAMEARIEVIKYPDGSTGARQSIIPRPDIWKR